MGESVEIMCRPGIPGRPDFPIERGKDHAAGPHGHESAAAEGDIAEQMTRPRVPLYPAGTVRGSIEGPIISHADEKAVPMSNSE